MSRIDAHTIGAQFNEALRSGLLGPDDSSFIFYDLQKLSERLQTVREAFGPNARHTAAIKSNPLARVLEHIVSQGFGLECASFEEVLLAQKAKAEFIAWDSPVKTNVEIEKSKSLSGLHINANGLEELKNLLDANHPGTISLRVNPAMDTGTHGSMSVAGAHSKFGERISNRSEIIRSVLDADGKVSGLHVHSSSQTEDYSKMTAAVRSIVDLADEINTARPDTITSIDIGGGFPAPYKQGDAFDINAYAESLKSECPELFDGTYTMITEFGRYYHANAGWTASRIHEVKNFEGKQVIIVHVGADLFVREAYNPDVWHHDFLIHPEQGGTTVASDIGGPLCFGGDYIAKNVDLPRCSSNDWLIVRDTGANSFALWSKHCSRSFPTVLAKDDTIRVIRKRDTYDDIVNFWG